MSDMLDENYGSEYGAVKTLDENKALDSITKSQHPREHNYAKEHEIRLNMHLRKSSYEIIDSSHLGVIDLQANKIS